MRNLALAAIASLLILSGCGKSDDPNSPVAAASRKETALPNGWKEISTSGITLAFPPGWKPIDLSKGTMDQGADAMFGKDPKYDQMRAQIKQLTASGLFKLFVFEEAKVGKGFGTNCNVTMMDAPAGTTPAIAAEQSKAQLGPMLAPGTKVETEAVTLSAGSATKMSSKLKTASPASPIVQSIAYLMVDKGHLYGVTFSCAPEDTDRIGKLAEQVMNTVHF